MDFPFIYRNKPTDKDNFIHEAQTEFHFCTVLSLMSPARAFQHLKFFYSNLHWQARCTPTNFANLFAPWTIVPTAGSANSANVGRIVDGGPADQRFVGLLTNPNAPSCNAALHAAQYAVRYAPQWPNVRWSKVWENFDVTR